MTATLFGQEEPQGTRLKSLTPEGLYVGGVLHGYDPITWESLDYLRTAEREFNAITASVYMAYGAWPSSSRSPDTSGFTKAVDWAVGRNLLVHGHTLCYPEVNQKLGWWMQLPNTSVEARLRSFVETMTRARRGKVWVWHVVNEVMADDGDPQDSDGLRTGYKEYKAIGRQYVDKAFQWAKLADPTALLILTDYGIEQTTPKSDRLLRYAKLLRSRGIPIHGIGFQMHWLDLQKEPDYNSIRANFQRFADAGFKLFVTELDVVAAVTSTNRTPTAAQLSRQRQIYQQIALLCAEQDACESVLMWDFADNRSWLHPSIVDTPFIKLGQYGAPAPFSGGRGTPIIAKPAYYGLQWGLTGQSLSGKTGVRLSISNHWLAVPNYLKFDPDIDNLLEPQSGLISSAPAFNPTSASNWIVDGISNDQYRIRTLVNGKWYYLTRQAVLDGGTVVPSSTVYLDDLRREWINQRWYILPAGKGAFTIQSAWSSQSGFLTRSSRIEKGKEIPMDELYIGNGDRSLDSRRWILF